MKEQRGIQISIDRNPFNSAAFAGAVLGASGPDLVEFYIEQISKSIAINISDVVFITMAMEILAESLKTHFNENDTKFYTELKKHSSVITIHKHNEDSEDSNEDNSEEEGGDQ